MKKEKDSHYLTIIKLIKYLLMTRSILAVLLFTLLSATLSSCSVIGDIFKAGVWVGVLAIVAVVGLIIYFITRAGGKK